MTIGNHNNELNARFHRNAVRDTIGMFKTVCDEMDVMLALPHWEPIHESMYDDLAKEKAEVICMLKIQGAFL